MYTKFDVHYPNMLVMWVILAGNHDNHKNIHATKQFSLAFLMGMKQKTMIFFQVCTQILNCRFKKNLADKNLEKLTQRSWMWLNLVYACQAVQKKTFIKLKRLKIYFKL